MMQGSQILLDDPSFHKWETAANSMLVCSGPECDLTNSTNVWKQSAGNKHLEAVSWQCRFFSGLESQPLFGFALESHPNLFPI